jgi:hypothetical protein
MIQQDAFQALGRSGMIIDEIIDRNGIVLHHFGIGTCCPTQNTLIDNEKQGENASQDNYKDLPSLECSHDEKQYMA